MSGYNPAEHKKPEWYHPERARPQEHPHGKGVVVLPIPGWGYAGPYVPRATHKRPRTALISAAAKKKIAERLGE